MHEPRPDPQNFLELKFVEFTIELARQKRLVRSGRWAAQRIGPATAEEGESYRKGNPVWRSMEQLFRRQEREARALGLEALYEKVRYPMLCLADQTFLVDQKWTGQSDWMARALEVEFTGHGIGGTEVVRRANDILERGDPTDDDLCKIYFYCLKLGFRGQYSRGSQELIDLQQRLRLRFQRRGPAGRLCEDAYQYTVKGGEGILIPSVRKTAILVVIVFAVFAGIFFVTNFFYTQNVRAGLEKIEERAVK